MHRPRFYFLPQIDGTEIRCHATRSVEKLWGRLAQEYKMSSSMKVRVRHSHRKKPEPWFDELAHKIVMGAAAFAF